MRSKVVMAGALAVSAGVACNVMAQTSVTIYGVLDAAMAYSSDQGGQSNTYMRSGNLAASRIGFKGTEDLGGGTQALFLMESGFESDTGAQSSSQALFNRQAYVGLNDRKYGALTLGRQYTPYYLLVGALGPVNVTTGATGAHPGDIDGLDTTVRANNSVTYTSPEWRGLQVSVLYGMGEQAGNQNSGSTVSAAAKYDWQDWQFAAGYQKLTNVSDKITGAQPADFSQSASASFGTSALNIGYRSADTVEYYAAAARYKLSSKWSMGANATSVAYTPGKGSLFQDKAIFNTGGLIAMYRLTPAWSINGAYSLTRQTKSNGITDTAQYQQLSFEETYEFTKRTALYFLQAYQIASGKTLGQNGTIVNAVASVGDSQNSTPSSNGHQVVLMAGLRHSF